MERLQIILLVLISSSWFLTCNKENKKESGEKKTISENSFTNDPVTITMNNRNADFYSNWLSLPFAGSGSNWMATIDPAEIPGLVLDPALLSVYMKKSDSIYKLTYKGEEGNIDHGFDNGLITISSNFNPQNIEFMYVISRDGTFVKQNIIITNYIVKLK